MVLLSNGHETILINKVSSSKEILEKKLVPVPYTTSSVTPKVGIKQLYLLLRIKTFKRHICTAPGKSIIFSISHFVASREL